MDARSLQQVMATLASREQGAPAGLNELLQQLGSTNPRMRLLAEFLANQRKQEQEPDEDLDDAALDEAPPRRNLGATDMEAQSRSRKARRLRESIQDLCEELDQLRERNDALARALGACYLCWGGDPECAVCRGRGSPGHVLPHAVLFRQLVVPALARHRAETRSAAPVFRGDAVETNHRLEERKRHE